MNSTQLLPLDSCSPQENGVTPSGAVDPSGRPALQITGRAYRGKRYPLNDAHGDPIVTIVGRQDGIDYERRLPRAAFICATGPDWGYHGSAALELATSILADHFSDSGPAAFLRAEAVAPLFAKICIATMPRVGWTLTPREIDDTLARIAPSAVPDSIAEMAPAAVEEIAV